MYRYASGEEPREGDVVRLVDGRDHCAANTGDVFVTTSPGMSGALDVIWIDYGGRHGKLWSNPHKYTLIARAGGPVTFQPGDVVERVTESGKYGTGKPGSRYTVKAAMNDAGHSFIYSKCGEVRGAGCAGGRYEGAFKLVHRPDAATPATEQPAPAIHSIAYIAAYLGPVRPEDVKVGDTVLLRMTVTEAEPDGDGDMKARGHSETATYFHSADIIAHEPAPTQPLKVGDNIRHVGPMSSGEVGELLAVQGGWAVVSFPSNSKPGVRPLTDYARA